MKYLIRVTAFLILIFCFSCEENGWFVKCSDCNSDEPKEAKLNVKLEAINASVRVNIYYGELEDSVLYDSITTDWPLYTFTVPLNNKYTVTATYFIKGNKYTTVSSATPRVKYTKDQCQDPCYFIYDNDLNLKIKYTVRNK